jgi:hypothetical protein
MIAEDGEVLVDLFEIRLPANMQQKKGATPFLRLPQCTQNITRIKT